MLQSPLYTDYFGNRISKFTENLPSSTLNVILFPEQWVEIRAFPSSETLIIYLVNKIFGNAAKTDPNWMRTHLMPYFQSQFRKENYIQSADW